MSTSGSASSTSGSASSTYSFSEFLKSFTKIEPLSNFEIILKCKQLQIINFKGVFMRDELKGKSSKNECLILNHDHSNNNGTHWTCLFIKNNVAYYFDSFGFEPPLEVINYCNCRDRNFNTFPIQKASEIICGHYSIYVLYKLSCGFNFYDVLDELYKFNHK